MSEINQRPASAYTIKDCLYWARQQLSASTTAILDAEVLLAHVLTISRAQLYAQAEQLLAPSVFDTFQQLVARRAGGEPVAYITGQQEFWSLPLQVTPDTLIPRPETECLVESVLAALPAEQICKIADLGTGSGAIALALAKERPHWQIIAIDKMPAALTIARQNAERLHINTIKFLVSDWCEALNENNFDAIVSNPPYINAADPHWCASTNLFEPITALLAADAGFADLHTIIQQARRHLKPTGWLMLEHGYDQRTLIQQTLVRYGYTLIDSKNDFAQIPRVIVARLL